LHQTVSVLSNRLLARGKFRHVQVLLKLAELGSVQRTADAIGMTQSSVTQTLAYLENLLEMPLFERHARGVRPTPACLDLLPVARQLLQGVAESAEAVTARRNQGQGVVRLLASAAAINGVLMPALPAFCDRTPEVQVHLREAENEDLLLAVGRGEVDLVVCRRPAVIPEGWSFRPLLEDRFVVVCAARHPLARRRRIAWIDLERETWLLSPAGSAARERFDALAARFTGEVRTYPLVTRVHVMVWRLLRDRRLLALMPLGFVRLLLEAGELAVLPVDAALEMQPLGVLAASAGLRQAPAALLAFLQAQPAA